MLIKWGSIVVDGSGKLGGHVFSKSRGGNTVRTMARATNPQTSFQQIIRSRFARLSQNWRDLTEVQRESWYNAESSFSRTNRFGDVVLLSGKNLYNSLNAQRNIIGLSALETAPMPVELKKSLVTKVDISIGLGELRIFGEFEASTMYVLVGSPSVSQGKQNVKNKLRIFGLGQTGGGSGQLFGSQSMYGKYVDRFGTPSLGEKIYIGLYFVSNSGQRSTLSNVVANYV